MGLLVAITALAALADKAGMFDAAAGVCAQGQCRASKPGADMAELQGRRDCASHKPD